MYLFHAAIVVKHTIKVLPSTINIMISHVKFVYILCSVEQ